MIRKIWIILFLAAIVGARHAVPLPGLSLFSDTAFADSYTQDGKPCPPECVSDSMEIVTWYPSPYNEYEELRLYPKYSADESSCDSFDKLGLMYYNKDEQALKVCWQSPDTLAYSWKDIALGQAGYWELSGNDIYNTNSGNVGIGKNNPAYKLDVSGKTNSSEICINGECMNSWTQIGGIYVLEGTFSCGSDTPISYSTSPNYYDAAPCGPESVATCSHGWSTTGNYVDYVWQSNSCPCARGCGKNAPAYNSNDYCTSGYYQMASSKPKVMCKPSI